MEAGDTFLRADSDTHLWIVLSSPSADPDNVLIVNLTTLDARKELACILNRGDHPWVRHETCVNYGDGQITTLEKLHAAKDGGAIRFQQPLAPPILAKILAGVLASERMKLDHAEILIDQGLVDC